MSRILRLWLLALLLPVLGLDAAPLPFAQMYEPASIAIPRVSPDGKRVALRAEIDKIQYLALMDTATMQLELSAKFEATVLNNLIWVGNDLLLVIVSNKAGTRSEFRAYDVKTQKTTFLSDKLIFEWAEMLCRPDRNSEEVVMQIGSVNGLYLARLNVRSGQLKVLEKASSSIHDWMVDRQGNAIAAYGEEKDRHFLQWRTSPTASWQRHDLGAVKEPALRPFAVHPDQKRLMAWDDTGEGGRAAIVALDPATLAKETILQHPQVDILRNTQRYWANDPGAIFGFVYEDDRPRMHFIDNEAALLKSALDRALPDSFNDIQSSSDDHTVLYVWAWSDRDAGANYIFNRKTGRLQAFGPTFPGRTPAEMGSSRHFSFQSKDGLTINGRILLPPGNPAKPPVLVRLGPDYAGPRAEAYFSADDQVFATRGYAVARIDYRGTPGYGRTFVSAGDYQFDKGMVDDVLLGIDFLCAQGWVDENKIGLFTTYAGGVVGLQVLSRSDRFKVWLNEETNLTDKSIDRAGLARTPSKDESKVIAELGGKAASRAYLESVQPVNLLPKIALPSFHLYERSGTHSLTPSNQIAAKKLKPLGERCEVVDFDPPLDEKPPHGEEFKARVKMFEFLNKWLPPAAPGR